MQSLLIFPFSAAHRTSIILFKPLYNAVHMKRVIAFAPHRRAIVARGFAIWAARLECRATNSTTIVGSVPFPCRHSVPARYLNLDHCLFTITLRALIAKDVP